MSVHINLYDSIHYLPKPNLRMAQVFALDNVRAGTANDGDRILDAGETVDLGVAVRNQWGRSTAITVTADASESGTPNPYVTFLNDTVTLEPAGTFQTVDNGFVWNDGLLTDVTDPIRFTLAEDTPNDTQISIKLTVTTTNGLDAGDTATYTIGPPQPTFTFRVQRGAAIRGHIRSDTTLTADKYWIVENALLIDEGATLTVEPGTQIQFWSSDYENIYDDKSMVYIGNSGTLNMIGSETAPIELFPGAGFDYYAVKIFGTGEETLRYCEIINPSLGIQNDYGGYYPDELPYVDLADHCTLIQNQESTISRGLFENTVTDVCSTVQAIGRLNSSSVRNIQYHEGYARLFFVHGCSGCIFENCDLRIDRIRAGSIHDYGIDNTVFLSDEGSSALGSTAYAAVTTAAPAFSEAFSCEGAGSKYVLMYLPIEKERQLAADIAERLGGALACFDGTEEENGFALGVLPALEATHEASEGNSYSRTIYVDYTYDADADLWKWGDGSDYAPSGSFSAEQPYETLYIYISPDFTNHQYNGAYTSYQDGIYYALEFPASLSDAEIAEALAQFDMTEWANTYPCTFYHSAILNPILDTDVELWLRFTAPEYSAQQYYPLHSNYWGTENSTLINKMIVDDVNNDGSVSEMDAVMILRKLVQLEEAFPSGGWRFVPAAQSMTLAAAAIDVVFTAILMGDVNGSWGAAQ